jgi:hypothetical protein
MRSVSLKASFANRSIARVLVTLAIASSLLSTVAPFSTASSTKQCAMACCAGKAPHPAGSCVHESCETPPQQAQVFETKEHLCGEEVLSNTKPVVKRKQSGRPAGAPAKNQNNRLGPNNAVASFKKPCPPDCGAAICSSANQRRQHESSAISLLEQVPPPLHCLSHSRDHVSTFRELYPRSCGARAPPGSHT